MVNISPAEPSHHCRFLEERLRKRAHFQLAIHLKTHWTCPIFSWKYAAFREKPPRNAGNRAEIVVDAPLGGEEWGCSSAVKANCKSLHPLFAMYQQDAATGWRSEGKKRKV